MRSARARSQLRRCPPESLPYGFFKIFPISITSHKYPSLLVNDASLCRKIMPATAGFPKREVADLGLCPRLEVSQHSLIIGFALSIYFAPRAPEKLYPPGHCAKLIQQVRQSSGIGDQNSGDWKTKNRPAAIPIGWSFLLRRV